MKTNYHTHTYRCGHAHGNEEEMIKAAIHNYYKEIGKKGGLALRKRRIDEYNRNPNYCKQCGAKIKIKNGEVPSVTRQRNFCSKECKSKHQSEIMMGNSLRKKDDKEISYKDAQPGDLLFYGSSKTSITHVAIYIGDGQIVHANDEKTGIIISNAYFRTPVKAVSLLE